MPFYPPGPRRPQDDHRVTWNDIAPRRPRDNPQYAMYKDVVDAIARLLDEDVR
jgi:hypothetical protein